MSEVLRAILTDRAVTRSLAFYTGVITTVSTITGTKGFARRQATIPCKSDCWFLAMGAAQVASFNGAIIGWAAKSEETTFQVQRAANYQPYSNFPQMKPNQNFNLNNFATWDEYILFNPAELITLIEDVQITDTTFVLTHTTFVTLAGVEYRLPGGVT